MSVPVHRIAVSTTAGPGACYEIVIGVGVWGGVPRLVANACSAYRYAVIADSTVAELFGTRLLRALHAAGLTADVFVFPAGEARKTRETWAAVTDAMLEAGVGRDAAVIALGGGVVGDLAGFVAATYMRGLPLVQLPTTLLAMIDASVGGKAGVNAAAGKNLIGAFWPPRAVVIDPMALATLPVRELRAGLAEAVKHGAIADAAYFATIGERSERLLAGEPEAVVELVVRSVEIKGEVVGRDEREAGLRRTLNFGHTIAHALEAASGYTLPHGEAVAIGMVVEARLGERHGVTEPGTAEALRRVLTSLGLPAAVPPTLRPESILAHTGADKKSRGGRAEYSLLRRIGEADDAGGRWSRAVPEPLVAGALAG